MKYAINEQVVAYTRVVVFEQQPDCCQTFYGEDQ